jgi:hypothetical protein
MDGFIACLEMKDSPLGRISDSTFGHYTIIHKKSSFARQKNGLKINNVELDAIARQKSVNCVTL